MLELFPQADVFTLVEDPAFSQTIVPRDRLRTSFLQRIPGAARHYRALLPLMPTALENLDRTAYFVFTHGAISARIDAADASASVSVTTPPLLTR